MDQGTLTLITEGLERILGDAPLEEIDRAGGLGADAEALWASLAENGYPKLCAAEAHGGFGATLADGVELATLTARFAAAVPLADTVLAMGLLSAARCQAADLGIGSDLRIGMADPLDPAAAIPHAAQLDAVLTLSEGRLRCARVTAQDFKSVAKSEDGAARLAGPLADVLIDEAAPEWLTPQGFRAHAALNRAAQMAGAMQSVLTLTLNYTQEREQFGRPLAKFQAVQHHLSDIACETAASIAAVELASDALRAEPECSQNAQHEIAIAKTRCGEAAAKVAAAAHQAHGAMGFTREYALGRYTRRLWQWQDEFGSETEWAALLGRGVFGETQPSLWPRISRPI